VPLAAAAPVSALSACLASRCAGECGIPCGGIAEIFAEPAAASTCENCVAEANFCATALACATSPACDAFARCWLASPADQRVCFARNETGRTLFRPLYGALANACAELCGYGSNWACAGVVQFPRTPATTITMTQFVFDYPSGSPLANAKVTLCTSCPCSEGEAIAEGATDAGGFVTLSWNQDAGPIGGGDTWCIQATAPGHLLGLAYTSVPITETSPSVSDSFLAPRTFGIPLFDPSNPNPNGNNLGAVVFDCLSDPAPGVVVSVAVPFTSPVDAGAAIDDGGGPADGQASVWDAVVDANGNGVFLFGQVPPGMATVTAAVPGVGVVSQMVVNIVPDATTAVALFPTAMP
jgi:hypothetical protein